MSKTDVKYKNVDKSVYGEVKEIRLIGQDNQLEKVRYFIQRMDQLIPLAYMIGVLLLALPAFLQSNSKLKQLLTNFTVWIIILLIILTFIYIFKD